MKKVICVVLGLLLLCLIMLLTAVLIMPGRIVKTAVERAAPGILGVPVTVDHVALSIFSGKSAISNLVIGNLPEFNAEQMFRLGSLNVHLEPSSLFGDEIRIYRIDINSPHITYELRGRRSNIGTLIENLQGEEKQIEQDPEQAAPGPVVIIDELTIRRARVSVQSPLLANRSVSLTLPDITLNNLGGEDQSILEISMAVLNAIFNAITQAIASSADLAGTALQSGIDAIGSGVGTTIERGTSITRDAAQRAGDAGSRIRGALPVGSGRRSDDAENTENQ